MIKFIKSLFAPAVQVESPVVAPTPVVEAKPVKKPAVKKATTRTAKAPAKAPAKKKAPVKK